MNIKLNAFREPPVAGGVFSRFMWLLPNALPYENVENIYLNPLDFYWIKSGANSFDWVFDQYYDDTFHEVECINNGTYSREGDGYGAIEQCKELPDLKQLCSKLKFKKEITDVVEKYSKLIGDDCLGVHLRTGDMNTGHHQYGIFFTEDYINKIKELRPKRIFLASDNYASIEIIKKAIDCDVIYVDGMRREEDESFDYSHVSVNYIDTPRHWQEAFIDCLLLSKCTEMLCRVSNVPNAAQLFSNTLTKIHRL